MLAATQRPLKPSRQVEYAMEAISQSGLAVGVLTAEGIVLAAEKRMSSKLLDTGKSPEKMYKIRRLKVIIRR